jgi:hypothetical protein
VRGTKILRKYIVESVDQQDSCTLVSVGELLHPETALLYLSARETERLLPVDGDLYAHSLFEKHLKHRGFLGARSLYAGAVQKDIYTWISARSW